MEKYSNTLIWLKWGILNILSDDLKIMFRKLDSLIENSTMFTNHNVVSERRSCKWRNQILSHAESSKLFWGCALNASCYTVNRIPSNSIDKFSRIHQLCIKLLGSFVLLENTNSWLLIICTNRRWRPLYLRKS